MLDIFNLRLEKVRDLLRSGHLGRMLLAKNLGDVGRATSVPCKDLGTVSGSRRFEYGISAEH